MNHRKYGMPFAGDYQFNALGDTKTPTRLDITGCFSAYVAGSLFRTSPGGYKVPRKDRDGLMACNHWFDGFTTVHKFDLRAGGNDRCSSVWYSSRSHVDELIEKARPTGKLDGITFGQKRDPCESFYKKLKTTFAPTLPGEPKAMNIGAALRPVLPAELSAASKT